MDFNALAIECAPNVATQTIAAIVSVESGFNPYAIGVVSGHLPRQPQTLDEAIATAQALSTDDWNFSVGLAQINVHNFHRYGITLEQAFDPCQNLRVGAQILVDCFSRHADYATHPQRALRDALSCYYSGNYTRGHTLEPSGNSYVQRVLQHAAAFASKYP